MKNTLFVMIFCLSVGSLAPLKAETADIYLEKGKLALMNKSLEESMSFLNKSIELDTSNFEAFYYRGMILLYTNSYFDALEDLNKSISLKPDFPDAYNNRGLVFSYIDELEKAIDDFNKAITLDPRFSEAFMNRGSAYLTLMKIDEAKKDFSSAEKLNPKNPELYYQKGRMNYLAENFKAAIKDYSKSIELGLNNSKLYYNRGNAFVKDHQFEKAVADYTEVLKTEPEDMEAVNNRAYAYDKLGKTELAAKDKERLEEIRLKLFPPVDVKSFKKLTDENGLLSMDVPEGWFYEVKTNGDRIDFILSRDSIDTKSDALVYGAIGGFFGTLPDDIKDQPDEAILEFWAQQQITQAESFALYTYLQKKNMKFKGIHGSQNISKVQFAKGYLTFIMTEFALAKNGKVFYCYFQAPETEYDQYKELFDKMEQSIEVNFDKDQSK